MVIAFWSGHCRGRSPDLHFLIKIHALILFGICTYLILTALSGLRDNEMRFRSTIFIVFSVSIIFMERSGKFSCRTAFPLHQFSEFSSCYPFFVSTTHRSAFAFVFWNAIGKSCSRLFRMLTIILKLCCLIFLPLNISPSNMLRNLEIIVKIWSL